MTAQVIPSLAMEPHVRVINGFQAACIEPMHLTDGLGDFIVIGDTLEEGVWIGEWHEVWFMARLNAFEHDWTHHRELVETGSRWPFQ